MTELDLEIPGLAQELIASYGKLVTYKIVTAGVYSPSTGIANPSTANLSIRCVVEDMRSNAFNADIVKAGDKKLTFADADFTAGKPSAGDIVVIDGDSFTVIEPKAVYSGDLVAIWQLQVRK